MEGQLLSAEQVADRLGLHVRTVRGYARDGRLKAVRIGKQYRIAQRDLEAFTGQELPAAPPVAPQGQRHVEVSAIVEIDAIDAATADRVTTLLLAAVAHRGADAERLRIETVYGQDRGRLKVILLGSLGDTARLLEYVEAVTGP